LKEEMSKRFKFFGLFNRLFRRIHLGKLPERDVELTCAKLV